MSPGHSSISMELGDPSVFVGTLTTRGKRTGLPRTVEINLIYFDGKFYATTASIENKHRTQNMIEHSEVEVQVGNTRVSCHTRMVTEDTLRIQILRLRDTSPLLGRVVSEMSPAAD